MQSINDLNIPNEFDIMTFLVKLILNSLDILCESLLVSSNYLLQMTVQENWRYCNKCQGLFFGPNPQGVCPASSPAGGPHSNQPSGKYELMTYREI
jgi:hypothetical protein